MKLNEQFKVGQKLLQDRYGWREDPTEVVVTKVTEKQLKVREKDSYEQTLDRAKVSQEIHTSMLSFLKARENAAKSKVDNAQHRLDEARKDLNDIRTRIERLRIK